MNLTSTINVFDWYKYIRKKLQGLTLLVQGGTESTYRDLHTHTTVLQYKKILVFSDPTCMSCDWESYRVTSGSLILLHREPRYNKVNFMKQIL